jgi:nucleotide-binding universal stress UspA family protein
VSATPIRPILICYDGSAGARRAIECAGTLFPGRDAIVLHTWRPVAGIAAAYAGVPAAAHGERELSRAALKLVEEGVGLAEAAGLGPRAQIAEAAMDAVWHAILSVAEQDDVAAVVLGARGLSPLKSAVLGSISHAVAQHAHRPVLIVPPASPSEAPATDACVAEGRTATLTTA